PPEMKGVLRDRQEGRFVGTVQARRDRRVIAIRKREFDASRCVRYFLYTVSRCAQRAFSSALISSVAATPLDVDVRRCCSSTRTLRATQIALPRKLGWELLYFFACSNSRADSGESVDILRMSPNTL